MITQKKLKEYLKSSCDYGYPEEYRNVIWCVLLQLPVNKDNFLHLKCQKESKVARNFAKCLSNIDMPREEAKNLGDLIAHLSNWSPLFKQVEFIPGIVYPFIKVFPNSQLLTFEIVATILLNYGQLWFEFYPLDPYNFLGMCENVLMLMDAGLAAFYYQNNITPQIYAWSLIKSSFSDVLSETFWFTLWDTIVSNPPYFLVFIIVAFNTTNRYNIMRLKCVENITKFFHSMNPLHIKRIIRVAHEMDADYPEIAHPKKFYRKFTPIPKQCYPIFDNFPKKSCLQIEDFKVQVTEINCQESELHANCDVMRDKLEEELRNTENAKQTRGESRSCQWFINFLSS